MRFLQARKRTVPFIHSIFLIFLLVPAVLCQMPPAVRPESAGMSAEKLARIDELVREAIGRGKMPGAVVLVGRRDKIVFRKSYGRRAVEPAVEEMTPDTIFDVASLTKPVVTATSVMLLVERGQLRLSDTVGKFIPEIEDENAKKVTVEQLLTHTSGYRPDFDLGEKWGGHAGMLEALKKERLRNPPGTKFVYSDIGFIVLGEIVERISGQKLNTFFNRNIYAKLNEPAYRKQEGESFFSPLIYTHGSGNTFRFEDGYDVTEDVVYYTKNKQLVAPTEYVGNQLNYLGSKYEGDDDWAKRVLRGQVHDPTASRMTGIAGHAGLFSTADDLARYCRMMLGGGVIEGSRVLAPATVALMTRPRVVSETGNTRGLGWDIDTRFSSNRGELFPLGSFGHTGFTGTGLWIDPVSETFVVFLSSRLHPAGKGDITEVRALVSTAAAAAVTDVAPERIRGFEAAYHAAVTAQLGEFRDRAAKSPPPVSANADRGAGVVLNGIDVLEKEGFRRLEGLRVGLVTNHTGRNLDGRPTIDILNEAGNFRLVSLFSPEHGIRGELDQSRIDDSRDERTGLPIYSLYGETRRPKPEQLAALDALVFDIQDIGTRFYTYISTLHLVLEEAARAKKKVYVLDRPNPINGTAVAGPVADADKLSFVATHTLPVRHGMTIGEIALMLNAEREIGADLEIVRMEGWRRSMWFDETNQLWRNPSPNMRSLTQATLYPGIGLLETTNLSVGRGTDTPFEIVGAPWLDGRRLAAELNAAGLPGVRFVPVRFTPRASVHEGLECGGVNIVVTDRNVFEPVRTGLRMALGLRRLHPSDWETEKFNRLLVNASVYREILTKNNLPSVSPEWEKDLPGFLLRRSEFLLYK